MAKYHARNANGGPRCGTKGTGFGFHVVSLLATQWNETPQHLRCEKCSEAIRRANAEKSARNSR